MPEAKQPHLNGAYYGPSIPPPSKTYHRPGRDSGGCGLFSCCCGCLCSCIFNLICQIVLTIVIIVGLAVFIFWLIFRPNPIKFHVTDASLTQFDLSSTNSTLYYNLALNMTIRNPNKRIGVYYDRIEIQAYYKGERFNSTTEQLFYQGHKKTKTLSPVFKGQNLLLLGPKDLSKYNSQKSSGTYSIDVKLRLRIRFKLGLIKTPRWKPKVGCDLKLPLNSDGRASGSFETKRCSIDW